MEPKMTTTETVHLDGILKSVQDKLGKTYEFLHHLGGGEFSNVYLVRDIKTGREYALKVLDYHYLLQKLKKDNHQDPQLRMKEIKKRFVTEAKLYKKIQHPNIVKIHDTGMAEDKTRDIEIPFIIMSYIKGSSLSALLRKAAPFPMARSLEISRDILNALEVMHQSQVIHRDIKPSNIMVEAETDKAIIIDFGIAKDIVSGTRLTTTGSLLGSPTYMAPEQFQDSSKVDQTIDIYSFGIVLYEMLTGQAPFSGGNFLEIMNAHREKPIPDPRQRNPQLSQSAADIINKTMAKDPRDRYRWPSDLLKALEHELSPTPGAEPAPKQEETGSRFKKFYLYLPVLAVLAAALVFLLKPFGIDREREEKGLLLVKEKMITYTRQLFENVDTGEKNQGQVKVQVQVQELETDFQDLKEFLNTAAGKKEKQERCRAFLNKSREPRTGGDTETLSMAAEADEILKRLDFELRQYTKYFEAAKQAVENHRYDEAVEMLAKARALEDTAEIAELSNQLETGKATDETQNGKAAYDKMKDRLDLEQYINFKKEYPASIYLRDLIEALKNKEGNLPPEQYWDETLRENRKGYYEYAFGTGNDNHRMVFIPGKGIWIDKYEVSNRQYRQFLVAEGLGNPPKTPGQFFHEGDEYPVVVTYETAERYCRRYGFRLPRDDEWAYAAGKGIYTYPWGNELPGESGVYRANFDSLGTQAKEEGDGYTGTAPVKSFEAYSSPFDIVNMAGNVSEWVLGRLIKGGSFFSIAAEDLSIGKITPGGSQEKQGFRCIKSEK